MTAKGEATLPAGPKARARATEAVANEAPLRVVRDAPAPNPGQKPPLTPKPKEGSATLVSGPKARSPGKKIQAIQGQG